MRPALFRQLAAVFCSLLASFGFAGVLASTPSGGATVVPQVQLQGVAGCDNGADGYPGLQTVTWTYAISNVPSGYTGAVSVTALGPSGAQLGSITDTLQPNQGSQDYEYVIPNSPTYADLGLHFIWTGAGLMTLTADAYSSIPMPGGCAHPIAPPPPQPPLPIDCQPNACVGIAPTMDGKGYWIVTNAGSVLDFGDAVDYLDLGGRALNAPIIGVTATPDGKGYWLVAADGGIFSFGDAAFYGSTGSLRLNKPVVGMAPTSDGRGYWLVAADGGIFSFGDAAFYGSTGSLRLNKPVVGMTPSTSGHGYYLVASDGGIFAFGTAKFQGSMGASLLNQPVVGMATDPQGGYWEVASDGGIFAFGGAPFYGSTGSLHLNSPIVAMTNTPDGRGYRFVARDGGIFDFGDTVFYGSGV